MTHQSQPTRTSCGPTCAAIIAGVSPRAMLNRLQSVRLSACRKRLSTHHTNIGEMLRLLKPYRIGFTRRTEGMPSTGTALLRIQHPCGRNWHYAVFRNGVVYDPARRGKVSSSTYFSGVSRSLVSFYQVSAVALCVLLLAGCGPKPIPPKVIIQREVQTVEVKVPVLVARVPPAELVAPLHPPRPEFVSPESPEASSALTAEGERLLRGLIEDLLTRIAAWETWATSPTDD